MPTDHPRISVTLRPATAAVLRRMSELTGKSQSGLVGELLEASQPVFERMARVIAAAKEAQGRLNGEVRANLEAAEAVLDKQLGLMLGDLEDRSADLVDGLERVGRRAVAPRSGAAVRAPRSNRGGAHLRNEGPSKSPRTGKAARRRRS